jgi:hypothetical protein
VDRVNELAAQAAYFRKRADDPDAPERDRALWAQLADEIEAHLAPPVDDQPTLMEM